MWSYFFALHQHKLKMVTALLASYLLLLLLSGCTTSVVSTQAVQGQLDLRELNLESNKTVYLKGDWAFYWQQLLTYEQLQSAEATMLAPVPAAWNYYSLDGASLPGQGYATYKLDVSTNLPKDTLLALRIYPFPSAYTLFINDKEVAKNGFVATTAEEEVGHYQPETVFFSIPDEAFSIILHVSNFQYDEGGFIYNISMGNPEAILLFHERYVFQEAFLHGALLTFMILFLAVYLFRKELTHALYFSILCLAMSLVIDAVGQSHILRLFPELQLRTHLLIWFGSINWLIFFLILYVRGLYATRLSIWITRIYFVIALSVQLFMLITTSSFFTQFINYGNAIAILGIISTYVIVGSGIRNGNKDGWLNLISMLVIFMIYVHDRLYWTNIITHQLGEFIYIGIFIFLVMQIILQANRIRHYHREKSEAELAFWQAQIKPHFLFNALNTVIYIISYDSKQAKALLINFGHYLRRSFDFKNVNQAVLLKKEIELAQAYISIEKARFEERLEVNFDYSEDVLDIPVPSLILQPILENAVIHGILPKTEGGSITIAIKKENNSLICSVKDTGVGFELSKLAFRETHHQRKGIGLANIHNRLIKLYGKGLEMESIANVHTIVTWKIPLPKKGGYRK